MRNQVYLIIIFIQVYCEGSSQSCPSSWVQAPDIARCYNFVQEKLPWEEARARCIGNEGDLLSLDSLQEMRFIQGQIFTSDSSNRFWHTGLNDRATEKAWVWADGTPAIPIPWFEEEPNNALGGEDCAVIGHPGYFNDISCNSSMSFICEKPFKNLGNTESTEPDGQGFTRPSKVGYPKGVTAIIVFVALLFVLLIALLIFVLFIFLQQRKMMNREHGIKYDVPQTHAPPAENEIPQTEVTGEEGPLYENLEESAYESTAQDSNDPRHSVYTPLNV